MNAYLRKLAWLTACAALSVGVPSCWGSSDRGGDSGAAGSTGAAGDGGPGTAGMSGSAGTSGSSGTGRGGTTGSAGSVGMTGSGGVPAASVNLFNTLLGKSQIETDSKVTTAVNRFF